MGFGALPDGCLDLGLSSHGRRSATQINNNNKSLLLPLNYDHSSFPISLSLGLNTPQEEDDHPLHHQTRGNRVRFVPKIEVENHLPQVVSSSPVSATTAGVMSYSFSNVYSSGGVKKEREYYYSGGRGGGGDCDDEVAAAEEGLVVVSGSRNSTTTTTDEDEEGSPRKKLRLTRDQSALLEESFKDHSTLNPKQKQALADQLNLRPRQVEVWFQNRRARTKLKQTEVDCELLKKCCETLTEENKRLHKELQELKSMKLVAVAPPIYMQTPAATLSMCPTCEKMNAAADGSSNNNDSSLRSMNGVVPKGTYFYNPAAAAAFSHPPSAAC